MNKKKNKSQITMPVIAASYIGPSLMPNRDALWEEHELPLNADALVNEVMGQPMRRAGRFIKMVACGGLSCLQSVSLNYLKGKKTGIFLPDNKIRQTPFCPPIRMVRTDGMDEVKR